ncbi:MAG: type I-U CRISPR-associated helicase/endonuclease Cas3 [Solirubrobacteraceae bacterium]
MSVRERFCAFFSAVNDGNLPYPWQCELVEHVAHTGRWPDISAPTGSGKSAVIDAHVFLVAEHAAGRLACRPPRRLVLIAPRRVLVDDQFDRATRLANLLMHAAEHADSSPLADAANSLRGLCTSALEDLPSAPLAVWRLRGGVLLDNGWRLEPAACQVICATPQMWGSRLLMRGYNASRASRNLEAGLLGHDAVAVIDEAHLHERLVDTARNVASHTPGALRLQVVAMSATRAPRTGQLGLTAQDLTDPALERRVRASKAIRLIEVTDWPRDVVSNLVACAQQAAGSGTVGVFVNDVATALNAAAALEQTGGTVELVCGRLRPVDISRVRQRRPGLLSPQGDPDVDFLVSTQSLEVGVDLDLPAMVTTLASASALAQRAGRLNRSGSRPDATLTVLIPHELASNEAARPSGPYSADELAAAGAWLSGLGGSISPEAVAASDLPLPPRPVLPALRAADLETLAMTSDVQAADPDIELYLEDPQRELSQVDVIARRHLQLHPAVVSAALRACPPRPHELASVPIGKALDRIVEAVRDGAWVVRVQDGDLDALPLAEADSLGPNDTLVVPDGALICTAGVVGIRDGKGQPGPLDDVLDQAPRGASQDHVLALEAQEVQEIVAQDPTLGSRASRMSLVDVLDTTGLVELANRLRRHRRLSEIELTWCGNPEETSDGLLVVRDMRARAEQVILAAPQELVSVDEHQTSVEQRMNDLLDRLNVPADELPVDALLLAARVHDEGKRHPRFQRRMGADSDVALAKPRPGHLPDRGDGWRHEQLSAAYAAHASNGNALLITLVAAHHGRGRALFDRDWRDLLDGWHDCPQTIKDWARQLFGPYGHYELMRADTQRTQGVHRLAWLEALVRCADMQISREGG